MLEERATHPLIKEVPGHLLQFEEKLFGMTLTQLLTDLGIVGMTVMLTSSLPLVPHLIVAVLVILVSLILVHGKVGGYTMLYWLYLLGRFHLLPKATVWRLQGTEAEPGAPRSVQETWLPMQELEQGMMGQVTPGKREGTAQATYWVVFQVESAQNVRYLAEAEQVKLYERFKAFLDGLGFPLKCLSLVEQVDPQTDPALLAQQQAIAQLAHTPRLRRAQQASLAFQRATLAHCTASRHYVVVSASTAEVARLRADGQTRSALQQLWTRLTPTSSPQVTPQQVKQELRVRLSIVKKAFQQCDVHATQLDDPGTLAAIARSLAPGFAIPSFTTTLLKEGQLPSKRATSANKDEQTRWHKRITGLHTAFSYASAQPRPTFEPGAVPLADLLAPSALTLNTDALEVTVRGTTRYLRYFEITGFAPELACGWQEELTTLAQPHDHLHHRGLWFAYPSINAINFWEEHFAPEQTGWIRHRDFTPFAPVGAFAGFASRQEWVTLSGICLLEGLFRVTVFPAEDGGRLLAIELTLSTRGETVELGQVPAYHGLGYRCGRSMDGGYLLNAVGGEGPEAVYGVAADWCSYSGKLDGIERSALAAMSDGWAGVAIFDHPANPRHPSPWFVMNEPFGFISPALTFHAPYRIELGHSLQLRYGVWVYQGKGTSTRIGAQYERYLSQALPS